MQYAFITGMGRSGTKLLTRLLACDKGIVSEHEYIGNRQFWLLSWYLTESDYTIPFLTREKAKIENSFDKRMFIDISGYLQNAVPALKKVFNSDKIFHLVRDPRKTIPSLYTRRIDTDLHLLPKQKHEIEKWLDGNKLYQICWNWNKTTSVLLEQPVQLIRFEDILSDYQSFRTLLIEPLKIEITEEDWKKTKSEKINRTRSPVYRWLYARWKGKPYVEESLPSFEQWSGSDQQMLLDICGETMQRCGYRI
ncbi:MAG: hypothetical protein JNL47_12065 [Bacteroidia bacterium]|nr:hypothetical protein [Bacteroidia bacterium]